MRVQTMIQKNTIEERYVSFSSTNHNDSLLYTSVNYNFKGKMYGRQY